MQSFVRAKNLKSLEEKYGNVSTFNLFTQRMQNYLGRWTEIMELESDRRGVDWPSLLMVVSFLINILACSLDPVILPVSKNFGFALFVLGAVFFSYVLIYLRSGFFGQTSPKLDFLITNGPYKFCRHPQYLSFIIMIFGIDLMFRSFLGIIFTIVLSIPSLVYRAKIEDELLRKKFGEEWEKYSEGVGFLFPKIKRRRHKRSTET